MFSEEANGLLCFTIITKKQNKREKKNKEMAAVNFLNPQY